MLRTVSLCILSVVLVAGDSAPPAAAEVDALIDKAQNYLLAQQQANGAFATGDRFVLGITALAAEAVASQPRGIPASDARIARALAFINGYRQPDGGIYNPAEGLGNYTTSLALLLWTTTGTGDPAAVKAAQEYLFSIQNRDPASPARGGIGYGSRGAGAEDLSNTSWAIHALRASGVPASDPRMQEALRFLERCQDLSRVNPLPWARDSGGGVYAPDESKAAGSWNREPPAPGEEPPRLVPYGSMTYALIASYIALDLKPDDPRVRAAFGWVTANWTFDRNPGMINTEKRPDADQQGLYYYYRVAARTFDLLKTGPLELRDGRTVDWRSDLFRAIATRAKIEGDRAYWINPQPRWGENMPTLTTAYVLRSLKWLRAAL
ncbi:MAG: terpene cyclase/mutase family protein [Planctomycetota bacterium]|nr:terpene cyclase/mutase family protein [Planctomycetota bacterium]MCX8039684.1 terpene cyclase/mutase family protein [Planctomycetota bacterium]MDW8373380.1 terpene cyclase/mutase family protein [Planctomycetota bacterium]